MRLEHYSEPLTEVVAVALNLRSLRVVETEGNVYDTERQQWDSGNNVVAMSPVSLSPMTAIPKQTTVCVKKALRSLKLLGVN